MKYFRIMWISFACKSSIPLKKKDVKKQLPSNLISLVCVGPKGFLHQNMILAWTIVSYQLKKANFSSL